MTLNAWAILFLRGKRPILDCSTQNALVTTTSRLRAMMIIRAATTHLVSDDQLKESMDTMVRTLILRIRDIIHRRVSIQKQGIVRHIIPTSILFIPAPLIVPTQIIRPTVSPTRFTLMEHPHLNLKGVPCRLVHTVTLSPIRMDRIPLLIPGPFLHGLLRPRRLNTLKISSRRMSCVDAAALPILIRAIAPFVCS